MDGAYIEGLLQSFVDSAAKGTVHISEEIIKEFGEGCKAALRKSFTEPQKDDFRLRMSNIGRPKCQLKMERDGVTPEPMSYDVRMRLAYGDMLESLLFVLIRSAGIPVDAVQQKVSLQIDDRALEGTLDIIIDGRVYDIKSSADWTFKNKWAKGFEEVAKEDAFGYVLQGFGYAAACGIPFGGWIVINKNNGELKVVEVPDHLHDSLAEKALAQLVDTYTRVSSGEPFAREYEDEEETYYKKPSGNRKLGTTCRFCSYKHSCWPDLQVLPSRVSTAQNPPMVEYTLINDGK